MVHGHPAGITFSGQGPSHAPSAPCLCPLGANQPCVLGGRRPRSGTPHIVKANQTMSVHELFLPSSAAMLSLPSPSAQASLQIFLPRFPRC